ncbi:M23 family metallopeptidase [Lysobacter sp. A3-1-A15]|uniref:M23 family metallopeptidase n=1 Tax=Novilysobacter viscosus TaxID=3098602 RepID=UPI002ED9D387
MAQPFPRIACAALLLAIGWPAPVEAAKIYRWKDADGVTQYGDQLPAAEAVAVTVIPVEFEPGAIAQLRVENQGSRYLAWADNRLSGPIEVRVRFQHQDNIAGRPALPTGALLQPGSSALVAQLATSDPTRGGRFELHMDSVPGDPAARPRDVEYRLPLEQYRIRVDQGYGGRFSHDDPANQYAVDFAAAEGTPVLAAREGVVMQVESDFQRAGLDREAFGGRANFVRIVHDDGSMALYAHLQPEGAYVRVGQRVRTGQQIGLSGNTGFTTGPHLHFAVQVNRGMRLESIPFRMNGPTGPLRIDDGR